MSSPSALHSKKTPNWGTPNNIIEPARILLDNRIDLDPASSLAFNELVQATNIYTLENSGLIPDWLKHVFLNPPGGLVNDFWEKLIGEILAGRVEKAFWIGFSVEQLCTLASHEYHPMDFSTCILRKRICFNQEDLTPGGAPSHGNYVTGLGTNKPLFDKLFQDKGRIIHGSLA